MGFQLSKRLFCISITVVFAFALVVSSIEASDINDQPEIRVHFKIRIKAGVDYEKLIQELIEIRNYFNAKFKPEANTGYIEKTSEGNILHIYTDYKSVDAYKRAESNYFRDSEWQAKYNRVINSYCEGDRQYVAYVSATIFREETPIADLSKGQDGNLFFTSINLGSFKEILAGEGESKPVKISGVLKMPKEAEGKVPAVIILHGAGGVNNYYFQVADSLNKMGIAAFVIDSLKPRGIRSSRELMKELFHSYAIRISDAYAALELLSTHPRIDRNKIAVLGYSHGGMVALFVASEKLRRSFIADDLRFAASIAYYPHCATQFKDIDFADSPVLMLLAEKDNICPIGYCLEYAKRMKESGADVKAVIYKGAHHMFPVLAGEKTINVPELPDWSLCGNEELLFLREDGTWFFPQTNKTVDGVNGIIGDYTASCRIDGGAIIGGNSEAKIESTEEYKNLLRRVFNIK